MTSTPLRLLACAALLALAPGCFLFLPYRHGRAVYVDNYAGQYWSGEGVLTEVSPDRQHCKVYARNRALIVEGRWVECRRVHPRGPIR